MIKYTEEQTKELVLNYRAANSDEGREIAIQEFMKKYMKSSRSVVAKLSKLGIYIPKEKVSKVTGGKPVTKEAIVKEIAELLNLEDLEGLDKAPKLVLLKIVNMLKQFERT